MYRVFFRPAGRVLGLDIGDVIEIPEDEARRLHKVLRLSVGDTVSVFDGEAEYDTSIISLDGRSAELKVNGLRDNLSESPVSITLGQGLPKGEKLEWALQKTAELGLSTFIPVVTSRSIKRPDDKRRAVKLERLNKIASEAARQCGRLSPPDIPGYMDLTAFLEATTDVGLKLLPYEGEGTRPLRDILEGPQVIESVAILVGPEGGFAKEEVQAAVNAGYLPVGLGPRILRTETAGIAAVSIIQYIMGDLGR